MVDVEGARAVNGVRTPIHPATRARLYRALVEGFARAFALADTRPDLLRGEPAGHVT